MQHTIVYYVVISHTTRMVTTSCGKTDTNRITEELSDQIL